jgi:hypothetical protein
VEHSVDRIVSNTIVEQKLLQTMSSTHLPSSRANSGYQQRATQPPHTLAPRPQSKVILGFQSVLMPGQATGSQSDLCEQYAEVRTSTYEWVLVSITDMQRPGALNGPSQIASDRVPLGMPPFTGNGPKQKYVSKPSEHFLNSIGISQTHVGLNAVTHGQHRSPSEA